MILEVQNFLLRTLLLKPDYESLRFSSFYKASSCGVALKIRKIILFILKNIYGRLRVLIMLLKLRVSHTFHNTLLDRNLFIFNISINFFWLKKHNIKDILLFAHSSKACSQVLLLLSKYITYSFMIFFLKKTLFYFKFSFSRMPVMRKKVTVLRSPHTHKGSREQFELVKRASISKVPSFVGNIGLLCRTRVSSFGTVVKRTTTSKR